MMNDDMALVRDYAASQAEPAFATLVGRHIALVHSVALRQVGDAYLAQDVTQAVFIILARKAGSLGPDTILSAWLYRTACYVAAETRRTRHRREQREQEAYMQSTLNDPEAGAWEQLSPLLDEAMAGLSEPDRAALVLRFFENKTASEIAAAFCEEPAHDAPRMGDRRRIVLPLVLLYPPTVTLTGWLHWPTCASSTQKIAL